MSALPSEGSSRKSLIKIKDSVLYYPHQILGVRDLARRGSFLLCDEMGLGKTLQAYTVAAIDFERGWANRILVVSPATLKWNWYDELEAFTNFTGLVLNGTPKQRLEQIATYKAEGIEVLIVNYEQVVAHLDDLNACGFDIVIFDEAHYLKTHNRKRTKACIRLRADRKFLLTGSPLLNQVNELFPLLHIVDPDEYSDYYRFVNRYAVFGGYKDKQIVGVKNEQELNARVQKVMLRRLKKDVLDLPAKQYIPVRVDFHPNQERLYKQVVDELRMDIPANPEPMDIENALTKFLRLKQICGTTYAIDPSLGDHSYKLDRATELVEEIVRPEGDYEGEPVVVFTQFRGVQAAFIARLEALGIKTWQLNGDTPQQERTSVVRDWGSDPTKGALVCMLQVAGVGLNMTQANKCIFLDKLFVPKLNEQAEDRLHRIGADKTRPIQIYEMIVRKSIEQRIETILRRKRKLFDTLVEDTDWKRAIYKAIIEEEGDA